MEVFKLKCTNGMLLVYEDRVVISRDTVAGFLLQGFAGEKTFFYKDLTGIEYRKPTIWANGYMKFITPGTREINHSIQVGTFSTTQAAAKDSNAVILRAFRKEVPVKSEKIYKYIMERVEVQKSLVGNIITGVSEADEILKFKKLLDDGIITQDEFEKKKQELLNK